MTLHIRPFEPADEEQVAAVWHRSGRDAYTYLPWWETFSPESAREAFAQKVLPACDVWIGVGDGNVTSFMTLKGSYIDRLYVDPPEQRKGWGARLLRLAKASHPAGLELHTHQENHNARAFYEKRGFRAVKFGTSPSPESVPDVEYHWRPDGDGSAERAVT
jgi:ribosomal protein S18 acetylase RimI-like enzyme